MSTPTGHVVDLQFVAGGRTGAINYSAGSAVDVTTKVEPLRRVAEKLAAGRLTRAR